MHGRCAASSRTKRTQWLLYESSRMVVRSVCMCVVGLVCERVHRWHFLLLCGDDCRKGVAWASVSVVGVCACVAHSFFVLGLHFASLQLKQHQFTKPNNQPFFTKSIYLKTPKTSKSPHSPPTPPQNPHHPYPSPPFFHQNHQNTYNNLPPSDR